MITIKILAKRDLPQVMLLTKKIFDPILQGLDNNEDKNIWWDNYQNGLLLGAFDNETLVGYIFFYDKDKRNKSMHCWMDGVDEAYRNQGIFTSLMSASGEELKRKGYEYMTINTFPEKFPAMYDYLKKHNFIQYKEEEKEWNEEQTKKVFFRKKL